jgi:hypothetical protein
MISIPQHGPSGELYDLHEFFADIDVYFDVDAWHVRVEECLGEGAETMENRSVAGVRLEDSEFRAAYRGIYQTIDGEFSVFVRGAKVAFLRAIDSTSWDVEGSPEFERHMSKKYGGREVRDDV